MSDLSLELSLARLRAERCVLMARPTDAGGRPVEAVVVLTESGEPHAYRNECMHIAIPLALFAESVFVDESLLCATHGARYRLEDGYCYEGPCLGQSLERLPLTIDGDRIRIRFPENE